MKERFRACMILAGVGDAMGYKNGSWEFCSSGAKIHKELNKMTEGKGVLALDMKGWSVSDDTVMHLATAEGLVTGEEDDKLLCIIGVRYIDCWSDMGGRAPGGTCSSGVHRLKEDGSNWKSISFSRYGGGCGAAMRAMCVGLRYPHDNDLKKLIKIGIESGKMTHHNPVGFYGSFAVAYFVKLALNNIPPTHWGYKLMEIIPQLEKYLEENYDEETYKNNIGASGYFIEKWENYLTLRKLTKEDVLKGDCLVFPSNFDQVEERDIYYKTLSFCGWAGASGHDASIIGYDALLYAGGDFEKLCLCGMLHAGDSDSTGTIAGALFGALYGFKGIPETLYKKLEYKERMVKLADQLLLLSYPNSKN
eukprot:TRINITY_DN5933_c0_g1_i2.p1 TRINITY_DN5933_c0_g1~~TRINITY_DN5933_c0_g1_i2.p1  ORF type:complete len:382 (+),score=123.40 TRINITY_DN5933_c0_g1_i2:59-1147(+)